MVNGEICFESFVVGFGFDDSLLYELMDVRERNLATVPFATQKSKYSELWARCPPYLD